MARVLLFGPLRDLAGWREREIESASLKALRAWLAEEDERLLVVCRDGCVRGTNHREARSMAPWSIHQGAMLGRRNYRG